ncbi:uncharacterized protein ACLA_011530 [Aspergillus clavatus NRRL 1]|uniref:Conserved glutamic acid rich protein n=1 Tax=Aspergillus clavatus (strain ATCC 1007 / CBS 513.65 / DSM 816 / NCTC 3887 / NRRL 1 / QM 1276 / 107) TaxID=344612 RepID=A1CAF8_ASPCL|nr:conserved glutamic acid rich protein [Aspergillus clavatus NRRL 1]EAW12726.1 conserved glutamic acid rich protein [Aspergillus clavatus NRRL 1]
MSRRARNHEFVDEDLYEEESDTYRRPRRSRRGRHPEDEEIDIDYRRRMSVPLPVEELERLHIRERSTPDFMHESFDPLPRNPGPLAVAPEREMPDMLPREVLRGYEMERSDIPERRERRRPRKAPREKDVYFQEELERRRHIGDGSDEEEYTYKKKKERPVPRHDYDTEEEFVRLHRDRREKKKGSRLRHSELDLGQDEFFRGAPDPMQEYARDLNDAREPKSAARLRRRVQHQSDDNEKEEEDIIVRKDERKRGRKGRFKEKEEVVMRQRRFSTSPESPSSRELSQVRRSLATPRGLMDNGVEIPRAPRAPRSEASSPSSFDELEIRHRRRGRPTKENIIIERRKEDSSPPASSSSESEDQEVKDELDTLRAKLRTSARQEDVVIMEREPKRQDIDEEIQAFEEEHYTRRDLKGPPLKNVPKVSIEDKAIVLVGAEDNSRSDQDGRRRQQPAQRSRSITGPERLSDENVNRKHGQIGRRYIGTKEKRDRLWTEITKDLVVREAIERAGYEFEETESFYYIFSYLQYDDISALVALSEDIRRARRRRIQEIERERQRASKRPAPPAPPAPFPPEPDITIPMLPGRLPSPRLRARDERRLKKERELIIEEGRWRPAPARSDRW